jgi:hypothetical protein
VEKQLSDVSSKYGAPMGREDQPGDPSEALAFELDRLRFVDGDYDNGGAYWGGGRDVDPMWHAEATSESHETVEMFLRAADRAAAKAIVLAAYPLATVTNDAAAAVQEFVRGYLTALLWNTIDCDSDDSDDSDDTRLDENYAIDDIAPDSLARMETECAAFYAANAALWASSGQSDEQAGHDFWMTRAGTGCGYGDGDYPEPQASQLEAAAQAFGERDICAADGKVHQNLTLPEIIERDLAAALAAGTWDGRDVDAGCRLIWADWPYGDFTADQRERVRRHVKL